MQEFVQLPNGWSVPASSHVEALFIYKEIVEQQCYLQEGIRLDDGCTVMDVGANIGQSVPASLLNVAEWLKFMLYLMHQCYMKQNVRCDT